MKLTWTNCCKSLKFDTIKVGIVVVISSLNSSHHYPAAASCHRHRLHCRVRSSIQLTRVAHCRCRTQSPSAAGPLPQQQPPHNSRVALHPAPVSQRVWMPCEGFEGDSAGQYRIDFSFRAVCAKLCAWKLYSSVHGWHAASSCSVFECATDDVCPAPARAGLLSLSLSLSLVLSSAPLQLLLTIAHQLLPSGSPCNLALQPSSFRGVCFSLRPPPQAARCRPAEAAAAGVCRIASPVFVDGRSDVYLLSIPHSLIS